MMISLYLLVTIGRKCMNSKSLSIQKALIQHNSIRKCHNSTNIGQKLLDMKSGFKQINVKAFFLPGILRRGRGDIYISQRVIIEEFELAMTALDSSVSLWPVKVLDSCKRKENIAKHFKSIRHILVQDASILVL